MSTEEAKATTKNAELMDVEHSPSNAALKMAYERTSLRASSLDAMNEEDEELLTRMIDLDIDLTDADVDSENIDEALAIVKNCSQLNALRIKMP